MQDFSPAHYSRAVRDVLSNTYCDRWIGRGGPTAWPPRSTLHARFESSEHLAVGGHLKALVYAAPVDSEEAHRTVDACQTISNYPAIYERMLRSMVRRVEA
jgi:hypothetical protein